MPYKDYNHTLLNKNKNEIDDIIMNKWRVRNSAWGYGYDRQVEFNNLTPLQIEEKHIKTWSIKHLYCYH